jgi:quercetin dioxygenase-like cupin family protein
MKGAKIGTVLALWALLVFGIGSGAASAAQAGPDVAAQGDMPATVAAGDGAVVGVILDFAPGAGVPEHVHGGPLVVNILSGALTLYDNEMGTMTYKAGESFTEMPNHKHSAFNRTNAHTRVGVSAYLPKGAELQTLTTAGAQQKDVVAPTVVYQAAYPVTVPAEDADVIGVALNFAPGAGVPDHVHGGPLVVQVLSGDITLTDETGSKTYKPGDMWTEMAGHVHNAYNRGNAPTQVLVSALIPKGAQLQTVLDQAGVTPSGMPRTGAPVQWPTFWLGLLLAVAIVVLGRVARKRSTANAGTEDL